MEDGRGPIGRDLHKPIPGTADFSVASDFYHRYKEDIALMAEMGLKTFRFSISWSRILPEGTGEVNPKGIAFYSNVIDECLNQGIEPLVTMFHFDMPYALEQRGGWGNPDSVQWFVDYARILLENYGSRVKYWLTINEQNVLIFLAEKYHTLVIPKDCENPTREIYQQNHRMLVAQSKVFALCHQMCPGPEYQLCVPRKLQTGGHHRRRKLQRHAQLAVSGRRRPRALQRDRLGLAERKGRPARL